MALKFHIDRLEDVAGPLREHYVRVGDKYQLATEGEHPKVSEFRDTNTRLMAELEPLKAKAKAFDGLDQASIAADKAKLAELDAVRATLATKESELAAKAAALTKTQQQADGLIIETKISDAFLKVGGLPKARAFIVAAASPQFTVEDGVLKGKTFSPNHPGQPMTVDEWVLLQTKEHNFCFAASSGGGSEGNKGGGATGGAKVLKDPTPTQLGEAAAAIKRGDVRVEYSNS